MMYQLYHGTSERALEKILRDGLRGRRKGQHGNWRGAYRSRHGFVYLSSWMPTFYGAIACKKNDKIAIIRVEVDEGEIYPDEDFIAQAARSAGKNRKLKHQEIDLEYNKHLAVASLTSYGSVAVKDLSANRVKDYRLVEPHMKIWGALGGDITPSMIAYHILGEKYKAKLNLLFDSGEQAVLDDFDSEQARIMGMLNVSVK